MEYIRVFLAISVLISLSNGNATAGPVGAGIIIGEPTGLTIKSWMSKNAAVDIALAWTLSGRGFLHIHTDYIIHNYRFFSARELKNKLALYYGMGLRVKFKEEDNINMGIRLPIGLNYRVSRSPFELFFEIVPILDLIPGTYFNLNGGFGARFYF